MILAPGDQSVCADNDTYLQAFAEVKFNESGNLGRGGEASSEPLAALKPTTLPKCSPIKEGSRECSILVDENGAAAENGKDAGLVS